MRYEFIPQGVCSKKMIVDISEDGIIENLEIIGGCAGNTRAISNLCLGRHIDEIITLLKGIPCRPNGTSCPNELAKGLERYKAEKSVAK